MLNAHTVARSLKDVPGMTTEILGNVIHKLTADGHLAVSGDAIHAVAASEDFFIKSLVPTSLNFIAA